MILQRISEFFGEVRSQARKVQWPTAQETLNRTIMVAIVTVGVAAFLGFLDTVFVSIVERLIL